jgi:hypothetical protein
VGFLRTEDDDEVTVRRIHIPRRSKRAETNDALWREDTFLDKLAAKPNTMIKIDL